MLMHMHMFMCHQNPNPRMLVRKQDWEGKPKGKIEVCCAMALKYVDKKEMTQQKVGTAAERCDFCRQKTKTAWVVGWPLLVSQKVLYPMLRRAAVPVLCYQCTWDQHQRGLWGEIVSRQEIHYCHRDCSTSPKKEWVLQMSHFHISPHHITVLAYTLVIGFSLGKAPSSLVGGGGCLHPTFTCCESLCKCSPVETFILAQSRSDLCSAMVSLQVSNTAFVWDLQSTSVEEYHTTPNIN